MHACMACHKTVVWDAYQPCRPSDMVTTTTTCMDDEAHCLAGMRHDSPETVTIITTKAAVPSVQSLHAHASSTQEHDAGGSKIARLGWLLDSHNLPQPATSHKQHLLDTGVQSATTGGCRQSRDKIACCYAGDKQHHFHHHSTKYKRAKVSNQLWTSGSNS